MWTPSTNSNIRLTCRCSKVDQEPELTVCPGIPCVCGLSAPRSLPCRRTPAGCARAGRCRPVRGRRGRRSRPAVVGLRLPCCPGRVRAGPGPGAPISAHQRTAGKTSPQVTDRESPSTRKRVASQGLLAWTARARAGSLSDSGAWYCQLLGREPPLLMKDREIEFHVPRHASHKSALGHPLHALRRRSVGGDRWARGRTGGELGGA